MEFLSSASWWISFVLLSISCFIAQLGVSGKGKTPSSLMGWGFSLIIGTVIAAFIFTGWQGGLTILVLSIVLSFISFLIIQAFVGRKENMEQKNSRRIDIENIRIQFKGKPFNQLIKHHLKKQKPRQIYDGLQGTMAMLPENARSTLENFIDRWNEKTYDKELWQKDTSQVFTEIVDDARSILSPIGAPTDDETLFNMFQIVVLTYSWNASDQPNMQKFIGI